MRYSAAVCRDLRSNLGLEVLEASRNFLENLCVSLRAGLPKLTHLAALTFPNFALDIPHSTFETAHALASPVQSGVRRLDRAENVLLVGVRLGDVGQLIQPNLKDPVLYLSPVLQPNCLT